MLEWKDQYIIGNRFIDSEHKILFEIANEVSSASAVSIPRLKEYFFELLQYTSMHFANEEMVMRDINYEALQSHQKSHADLIQAMKNLLVQYHTMGELQSHLEEFMNRWLVGHILREDLAWRPVYVAWVNRRLRAMS